MSRAAGRAAGPRPPTLRIEKCAAAVLPTGGGLGGPPPNGGGGMEPPFLDTSATRSTSFPVDRVMPVARPYPAGPILRGPQLSRDGGVPLVARKRPKIRPLRRSGGSPRRGQGYRFVRVSIVEKVGGKASRAWDWGGQTTRPCCRSWLFCFRLRGVPRQRGSGGTLYSIWSSIPI